jgi:Flp pilus assembly protein TadB
MSKQRQVARAERERLAAEHAAARAAEARRRADRRARRGRRVLLWRRVRLWQHGPGFRRHRETWGIVAALIFVCLVVAYLLTRSVSVVVGTALVLVVGAPVLVMIFFDRSRQ